MKQLMEYKIISGRTVEIRRSYMTVRSANDPQPRRAARRAGTSSEKKIKANEDSCVKELARVINSTFGEGDLFCALKYNNERLPESYEEAERDLDLHFLRQLRREFRSRFERLPKMVWVTANWNPKHQVPARLHHHLVIEAAAEPLIAKLWQGGGLNLEFLDNRGDHTDLAAYLVGNVHGIERKAKWHASRNVSRPIYTEPVPVRDIEDVQPEKGCVIRAHEAKADEDGHVTSSYLRCVLPEGERLALRGGKLVRTKGKKPPHPSAARTASPPRGKHRKGGGGAK